MGNHKTYYIGKQTSDQLVALSKRYNKSKSQIIRELVEQRYDRMMRWIQTQEPVETQKLKEVTK